MVTLLDLRDVAKLLTMAASAAAARMVASMLLPLFPHAIRERHRELTSWPDATKVLLNKEAGLAYLWQSIDLTERAQRWPKLALVGAAYDVVLGGTF